MTERERQLMEDFDLFEMGVLGPDDAAEMRRALAESDELRAAFLARDASDLLLGYSLREQAPSRDAHDNFLREMRHSQPARASESALQARTGFRWRGWPAWTFAAVAILLAMTTAILLMQNSQYRQANQIQAAQLASQEQQLAQAQTKPAATEQTSAENDAAARDRQLSKLRAEVAAARTMTAAQKQQLAAAESQSAAAHAAVAEQQQQLARMQSQVANSTNAAAILEILRDPATANFVLTKGSVKPQPQIKTFFRRSTGQVVLIASNLPPVPADKAYELWMIPADSKTPVPAGMFRPDAGGNVALAITQTAANHPAKLFAVTVEPANGSPAPTSAIVFSGAQGG